MEHVTACKTVVDTGMAIYKEFAPYYLKVSDTSMWRKIAIQFSKVWNFPNCIKAIDGKHNAMQAPPNAESDNFNYTKQFHSIILMAICDEQYKLTKIDLGTYGREIDKNVHNTSIISKKLAEITFLNPTVIQITSVFKYDPASFHCGQRCIYIEAFFDETICRSVYRNDA